MLRNITFRGISTDQQAEFVLVPFLSRVRHFSCRALQSYNSQGDWAREMFKHSTDSASLVVKIEKKMFRFGFELFWGERHK